jgi:hypothetical protein
MVVLGHPLPRNRAGEGPEWRSCAATIQFDLLNLDSARLVESLDLLDRDGPWSGASARGVCRIGRRARDGRTGGIGALERPRDYEMMVTSTDVSPNEVETVCRQSAFNKINTAAFIGGTASDRIEDISAELLESLVINAARCARCRREHGCTIERDRHLHRCRVRGGLHCSRHLRVVEQAGHQ